MPLWPPWRAPSSSSPSSTSMCHAPMATHSSTSARLTSLWKTTPPCSPLTCRCPTRWRRPSVAIVPSSSKTVPVSRWVSVPSPTPSFPAYTTIRTSAFILRCSPTASSLWSRRESSQAPTRNWIVAKSSPPSSWVPKRSTTL